MSDTFSNNRKSLVGSTYSASNYENINLQKGEENQFISISKKFNERIVKNMQYQRRMGMLYNYQIKNQHKVEKQLEHKEDKQRKTRKDKQGRVFTCGQCKLGYLSYPALYTHIKTKHDGNIPQGTIRGVNGGRAKKRGRPKNRKTPLLYELDQQKNTFSPNLMNLIKRDKLKILNEYDYDVDQEEGQENNLQTKYFVQILKIIKKQQKPNIKLMTISKLIAIFLYNCKDYFDADALISFEQMFYQLILFINPRYRVMLKNYQQRSDLFVRIDDYPQAKSNDKKDQISESYCLCQGPQFFPYFAQRFIRQRIKIQDQYGFLQLDIRLKFNQFKGINFFGRAVLLIIKKAALQNQTLKTDILVGLIIIGILFRCQQTIYVLNKKNFKRIIYCFFFSFGIKFFQDLRLKKHKSNFFANKNFISITCKFLCYMSVYMFFNACQILLICFTIQIESIFFHFYNNFQSANIMNQSSSIMIILLLAILSCCLSNAQTQIPHCLKYNATNGACTTCEIPFKVSIGKCVNSSPSPYCISISHTMECKMCQPDYYVFLNVNYYDCKSKRTDCQTFSNDTKNCVTCVSGYVLNGTQGYCIIQNISNCYYQVGTLCYSCNDGYNLSNNTCSYYIQNCDIVELTSCTKCSVGYQLSPNNSCTLIPIPSIDPISPVSYDPFCKTFDNATLNICIQCSFGYYFNSSKLCTQVDQTCKTYNQTNGNCLSCYAGYAVMNNTCLKDNNVSNLAQDPNCNSYDFTKNICVKCAEGSTFNSQGKCVSFGDSNCQIPNSDLSGCQLCYKGYYFNQTQKKCTLGNYNCLDWNTNGTCSKCPIGYYLDSNLNCTLIDPACKSFNLNTKKCISCYLGYALNQNTICVQLSQLPATLKKYYDNCSQFDQSNKCLSCYWGYYLQNDLNGPYCAQVSPYCRTFNPINGYCTSCYFGYYKTPTGSCLRFM